MRWLGVCAILGALVVASPGDAIAAAKPKPESYAAFLAQVSRAEVKSAVLVPKKTTLRARLENGDRYVVRYRTADKRQLLNALHRRNVHVAFAKPHKKHHSRVRRRYIALAVVGLGVLASGAWVYTRRRRRAG
jgi:LPXTG-motif cell wall-anchored protein